MGRLVQSERLRSGVPGGVLDRLVHELLLDVPHAAVRARTRPRVSLAELSGAGWLSTASTNAESRWPLARLPALICGDGGI